MRSWPYATHRWRSLRASKLAMQPVCESCQGYKDLEVHHRKPITEHEREYKHEEAAFPPPALLQVLCKSCHSKVTHGATDSELTRSLEWDRFLEVK